MIRFLYIFFSWVPIIGSIIKAAYIASLVAKLKAMARNWTPSKPDQGSETGEDLDEVLTDEANQMIDGVLEPLNLGLVATIVRESAVNAVISIMRKRLVGGG